MEKVITEIRRQSDGSYLGSTGPLGEPGDGFSRTVLFSTVDLADATGGDVTITGTDEAVATVAGDDYIVRIAKVMGEPQLAFIGIAVNPSQLGKGPKGEAAAADPHRQNRSQSRIRNRSRQQRRRT